MERKESWDRVLTILREKDKKEGLDSKERTLMKVLNEKNSPLYIKDFLEDCSDFAILVRDINQKG